MNANLRPSDRVAVIGRVDPDATAASTVTSDWIDMSGWGSAMAIIQTGILGTSATVDVKLQEATDASGTGAKDITGKAITQLVKASNDDDEAVINIMSDELDTANAFTHIQMSVTVGAATSDLSGIVLGLDPRYGPASDNDIASVVEIVN